MPPRPPPGAGAPDTPAPWQGVPAPASGELTHLRNECWDPRSCSRQCPSRHPGEQRLTGRLGPGSAKCRTEAMQCGCVRESLAVGGESEGLTLKGPLQRAGREGLSQQRLGGLCRASGSGLRSPPERDQAAAGLCAEGLPGPHSTGTTRCWAEAMLGDQSAQCLVLQWGRSCPCKKTLLVDTTGARDFWYVVGGVQQHEPRPPQQSIAGVEWRLGGPEAACREGGPEGGRKH